MFKIMKVFQYLRPKAVEPTISRTTIRTNSTSENCQFELSRTTNIKRSNPHHIPVMVNEILGNLSPIQDDQFFLDMTFGGGGHTRHLLATNKKITIFALDRDPSAFQRALALSKQLSKTSSHQKLIPLLGRFSQLSNLLGNLNIPKNLFDGVIVDLGASQYQYDCSERGFSLRLDGPLDMRMDGNKYPEQPTAADVINSLNAEDLAKIFKVYGEERNAMKIAQAIVDSRFMMKRLNTTRELAELVRNVTSGTASLKDKLGRQTHPATKVFQALRIFVNNELNELNHVIPVIRKYIKIAHQDDSHNEAVTEHRNGGGLLAIISFHSLEDKIVKSHFMEHGNHWIPPNSTDYSLIINQPMHLAKQQATCWKFYKHKFMVPKEEEVFQNPRARSAKLRIGLRIH